MRSFTINIIGIITVCLVSYTQAGNYFTSKGSLWLGGTAGYASYGASGSDNRTEVFDFSPTFRVFPVKGFFIGPSIDANYGSRTNYHSSTVGLGAELGIALNINNSNKIIPYFRTGMQYRSYSSEYDEATYSRKERRKGFGVPFCGGVMFTLFDCVGLQLEPGMVLENFDGAKSNTFKFMIGFCGIKKHAVSILGKF